MLPYVILRYWHLPYTFISPITGELCRCGGIGRHPRLKIPWAGCSTQSELCLQTANFFNLIFLCVGTSLQHIPPTSYPSIGGIEYAAMVELVDTRDLKSRSGFQSTGSSPVSGTILLILRAVYCSENYFLGKIERIALAEDSLLFSSKWV